MTDVDARDVEFLTNEPVQGKLLSHRLTEGVLPPADALRIAVEVGGALQRAHAAGKVHGAVSPAAVMLTAKGARLLRPASVVPALARPYRSPEQVRGEPADWRSDIFSFGALLYELAGGRRPFLGTVEEIDEAILRRPAAALKSKDLVHAAMEGVIAGCMQKDPAGRRQRMQNAVIELKLAGRTATRLAALPPMVREAKAASAAAAPARAGVATAKRQSTPQPAWAPRRLAMAMLLIITVVACGVAGTLLFLRGRTSNQVLRFRLTPPEPAGYCGTPSVSPDGRYLACAAPDQGGQPVLWLHALDETKWNAVADSDGASAPFWSPDSHYLGFFAKGYMKRVALKADGGTSAPEALCESEGAPGGATWNVNGIILFAPGQEGGLSMIPATGGKPKPLVAPNAKKGESAFLWPQFLPDGKHFVFFLQTDLPETSGVAVGTVDPPVYRFLFESATNAVYSPMAGSRGSKDGYLLFIDDRNLRGQEFNPFKLELVGQPTTLATDIGSVSSLALAPISVSNNAMLAYQKLGQPTRQLVWMDRAGKAIRTVGEPGEWGPPRISPDGKRVVVGRMSADQRTSDLWLIEEDGTAKPFLSETGVSEGMPVWSPDGSRVAYWSNRRGVYDLYSRPVSGSGAEELLLQTSSPKFPTDWTRDNRYLLFGAFGEGTRSDIWVLPTATRKASLLVETINNEAYAAVSPDGQWVAYQSDESGRNEVYVEPFQPGSSETRRRTQVSNDGGGIPRWRADGGELYYLTGSGHVVAVATHPANGVFSADKPNVLFRARPMRPYSNLYDVSPDGQRFLINVPLERTKPSGESSDLMVMTNWTEKLK